MVETIENLIGKVDQKTRAYLFKNLDIVENKQMVDKVIIIVGKITVKVTDEIDVFAETEILIHQEMLSKVLIVNLNILDMANFPQAKMVQIAQQATSEIEVMIHIVLDMEDEHDGVKSTLTMVALKAIIGDYVVGLMALNNVADRHFVIEIIMVVFITAVNMQAIDFIKDYIVLNV